MPARERTSGEIPDCEYDGTRGTAELHKGAALSFIRLFASWRAEELLAVGEYIANGTAFTKGCGFAAWLGLAPKQMSTGDRTILGPSANVVIAISACRVPV
jgi:hypothetical protein